MPYYKTCQSCGSHLDPGERCDCKGRSFPDAGGRNVRYGLIQKTNTLRGDRYNGKHNANESHQAKVP